MACFIAPAVEAIAVGIAKRRVKKHEKKYDAVINTEKVEHKIPFSRKLSWLNSLLLGGSFLLLIEHIWHGEITAYFPFITAMSNLADFKEMLFEIGTVGVGMAILCTAVWGILLGVVHILEKKKSKLIGKLCV